MEEKTEEMEKAKRRKEELFVYTALSLFGGMFSGMTVNVFSERNLSLGDRIFNAVFLVTLGLIIWGVIATYVNHLFKKEKK